MKGQSIYTPLIVIGSLFLTMYTISCNQKENRNKEQLSLSKVDSLKFKLVGVWGNRNEKNLPVWKISYDSIYYYDQSKAYSYKILNGDLIIDLPKSKGVLSHISVIKDTMFFFDTGTHSSFPIRADRIHSE